MGTLVTITSVARSEAAAQAAATAGFSEIHRLEQLLSTWIPTSELSQVNASAGVKPVHVSPETMTIVQRAIQAGEMTHGGFNVAIGPAVEAWSVTEAQRIPTESELDALRPLVDLQAVHVDVLKRTIFLEKAGMRIDVGGIGKGYAADQAVETMQKAGAVAGVVALSGDIKTFGRLPDGKMFPSVSSTRERMDRYWRGLIWRTKPFLPRGITNGFSSGMGSDITIFSIRARSNRRAAARVSR
jgi:thiamine biosynthesis lipoprotein